MRGQGRRDKQTLARGITLYAGDCLDVLKTLPAASIDSVVCDPPYHLTNRTRPQIEVSQSRKTQEKVAVSRTAGGGFMGKRWDGGDVAFRPETWAAVLRVMKPGGHLVAFGGTRTYHRMACAIEDAGFEVRDTIAWLYGSGFPKSLDVSKQLDRQAGARRKVVGRRHDACRSITAPATAAARAWAGFGTALKPAFEPIILARKPLAPRMTVAGNVLAFRTGGINIDRCRVAGSDHNPSIERRASAARNGHAPGRPGQYGSTITNRISPQAYMRARPGEALGRWPANLAHDGSDEVLKGFPETKSGRLEPHHAPKRKKNGDIYGNYSGLRAPAPPFGGDSGSAARFFYCAKASKRDRQGSKHPTVKPIALMQWLVRLVTPPNGIVLDPFAGTGTTGQAALAEGFRAILIEREREYQADIRRRIAAAMRSTTSPAYERRPTRPAAVAAARRKQHLRRSAVPRVRRHPLAGQGRPQAAHKRTA